MFNNYFMDCIFPYLTLKDYLAAQIQFNNNSNLIIKIKHFLMIQIVYRNL